MKMLGQRNYLLFPTIKFVQEKNNVDIYKLDWRKFDGTLQKRHEKMRIKAPYKKALPKQYENLLGNALFALDQTYINEIQRNTKRAIIEWNTERNLDSRIRDICLDPAIAHVGVAFELLNDCLYNSNTVFLYHAMIYKFWCHQTGGALPKHHAKLKQLRERVENYPKKEQTEIVEFLTAVKKHKV
jgi:hypothetical protein